MTQRSSRKAGASLWVVATLFGATTAGVLYWGIEDVLSADRQAEERLVSSLGAGQTFARFASLLGPATTKITVGKYTIYQYERRWETLQAVVSEGSVAAYAVYAITKEFKPTLEDTNVPITLNSTRIASKYHGGTPGIAANLYCGAHKAGFFESFGGSLAEDSRLYVLGVSDTGASTTIFAVDLCNDIWKRHLVNCEDQTYLTDSDLTSQTLHCLQHRAVGRALINNSVANAYVETAPGVTLVPNMLRTPIDTEIQPS
jgi:hypothetical protein